MLIQPTRPMNRRTKMVANSQSKIAAERTAKMRRSSLTKLTRKSYRRWFKKRSLPSKENHLYKRKISILSLLFWMTRRSTRRLTSFKANCKRSTKITIWKISRRFRPWVTYFIQKSLSFIGGPSKKLCKCPQRRSHTSFWASFITKEHRIQTQFYRNTQCSRKNTKINRRTSNKSMRKLQFKSVKNGLK